MTHLEAHPTRPTDVKEVTPSGMKGSGEVPRETCPCRKAFPEWPARIWTLLKEDVRAALAHDPAARNTLEVLLCYPSDGAASLTTAWVWSSVRRLR